MAVGMPAPQFGVWMLIILSKGGCSSSKASHPFLVVSTVSLCCPIIQTSIANGFQRRRSERSWIRCLIRNRMREQEHGIASKSRLCSEILRSQLLPSSGFAMPSVVGVSALYCRL